MIVSLDYYLFTIINGMAGKSALFDSIFVFSTVYLIWGVMAGIVAVELVHIRLRKKPDGVYIIQAFLAAISAWLFNNLVVSLLYTRARPFVDHAVVRLVDTPLTFKSFPSDHTTIAFAFTVTLLLHSKRGGLLLLPLAIVIAFSRVYVGVHYPLDVVAGIVVGTLSAFIWQRIFKLRG